LDAELHGCASPIPAVLSLKEVSGCCWAGG
jgi:hypothetical protein